jgi:pimeloyl-ACP methyl ester carboxylesterase
MRLTTLAAAAVLATVVLPILPAYADPGPRRPPASTAQVPPDAHPVRVGTLLLEPCNVVPGALCGSVDRPWEPSNKAAGTITVGFAFRPATDKHSKAIGTLVPHEGGPGYSTTGTASSYVAMYGDLLEHRNLLLVDQRGTGRSAPVRCPRLQNLREPYADAAAACGAALGDRADDYTTALSADDLAAVIGKLGLKKVDVYGDSYGTFFTQVFVGRHPDLVRTVVLDASYPTFGENGWYPTQGGAMRRAFDTVCERSAPCRTGGAAFEPTLRRVLAEVRDQPWHGRSHDADGRPMDVVVDGSTLVDVAFGATYAPAFYRELTAALRSGSEGDRKPLLRLVAEATGGGTDSGAYSAYSEGLDAAVACHDYPQLYDMTASPAVRRQQYAAALAARQVSHPHTYGPFTIGEYAGSGWQYLDWCTDWPAAPADNPAGPPMPPSGGYPDVPVLILTGELDTITTPAEATLVARQFPYARRVVLRNSFHVTAVGDTDDCAQRIVRFWIDGNGVVIPNALKACARRIPPVRALARFPRFGTVAYPTKVARVAALTVADLQDRWWNNYSGHGVGLRGGRFTYAGYDRVRFALDGFRLARGLAVSGTAVWDRVAGTMTVDLRVRGVARGRLAGSWDTQAVGARAVLDGRLDKSAVHLDVPAP